MNEGGLDYKINVSGNWDAELKSFEDRIAKLKADAAKLSSGGGRKSTSTERQPTSLNDLEKAQQNEILSTLKKKNQQLREAVRISEKLRKEAEREAVARTKKDEAARIRDAQRANAQITKNEEQERARIAKLQRESILQNEKDRKAQEAITAREAAEAKKAAEYNDVGFQASQRNLAAKRELAIKEAQINQLMRDQGITARRAAEQVGLTSAQAKQLRLNMWDAEHAARQFLFTFRRLVGILAVFTLARKFAQAIGAGVREMVRFNAEIETARTGIASIISSVGTLYDAQGNLVTGAEAFNIALGLSSDLIKKLRKDAIGSVATFESLVQSFQVAVGPGLAAGLNLDQVRVLSKRLSEAAITMGIPINQLSEEIRSLLQGTATARNTRIAALFGGAKEANEAIRIAKEQGKLYEVLSKKLEGVALGTDAAKKSFKVLASDLKDSFQLLLAEGGIEYFESLKVAIDNLKKALVQVDTNGDVIGVSPGALAITKEFSSVLTTIVQDFQKFAGLGDQASALNTVLVAIAGTVRSLSPLLFTAFNTLALTVSMVLGPISKVLKVLGDIQDTAKETPLGRLFLDISKYAAATALSLRLWVTLLKQATLLTGVKGLLGGVGAFSASSGKAALILTRLGKSATGLAKWGLTLRLLARSTNVWILALTVVSTTIGIIGKKLGWWDALSKEIGNSNKDIEDSYQKQLGLLLGNVSEVEQGARSAEDWRKEIEQLERDLKKSQALAGLVDDAKELGEILQKALGEFEKGTQSWKAQADSATKEISRLDSEIKDLNADISRMTKRQFNIAVGISERDVGIEFGKRLEDMTDEQVASFREALERTAMTLARGGTISDAIGDLKKKKNEELSDAERKLLEAVKRREVLEQNILEVRQKAVEQAEIENKIFALNNPEVIRTLESNIRLLEAKGDLLELAKQAVSAEQKAADAATQGLQIERAGVELARQRREANLASLKSTLDNQIALEKASGKQVLSSDEYLKNTEATKGASQAVQNKVFEINKLTRESTELTSIETRKLEEQTKQLRIQLKLLEGDLPMALSEGLKAFIEETPSIGTAIADATKAGLDGVAGAFGSAFREYLATGQDVRYFFLNALSDVFLNIAEQFATNVAKNMLASLAGETLGKFILPAASNAPLIASNTALIASINANTTAMGGALPAAITANTAATTGDAAATTANTGGLLANTGSLLTNTASLIGTAVAWTANTIATIANSAALAASSLASALGSLLGGLSNVIVVAAIGAQTAIQSALLLAIAGLLVTANGLLASIAIATWGDWATPFPFKKGGVVPKGYALGGEIGGFARPASIPASDTVPAWLTPGEYVLPVGIVDKLGVGFLDALRSGVVSPSSFRSAASSLTASSSAIRGLASGGPVVSNSNAISAGNRPVNVAFFDDRKAMRRWAESSEGETSIMKVMQKNSFKFA